jgi:hypothetical protein
MTKKTIDFNVLYQTYDDFKLGKLRGRYLKEDDLLEQMRLLSHVFKIKNEGYSEEGKIISSFHIGSGSIKILIWSQMHGNESTTTKAILDFLNFIRLKQSISASILDLCSFVIIPVLNPDGAVNYTRVNANEVDLNRDALNQSQSESQVLNKVYREFQPDYCFNMHDQRTIFSAGHTDNPATVSFLSPAYNEARDINSVRKASMGLIASASSLLQTFIPNQVGRYDDGFNINCVGDYFQSQGTPTILFEAGHYPNDYEREETRKFIFLALINMIQDICLGLKEDNVEGYFAIPENEKRFYDVIIKNVKLNDDRIQHVFIQYKEVLSNNQIDFIPIIDKIDSTTNYYGHREIEASCNNLKPDDTSQLEEGMVLKSFQINNNVFVI